MTPARPAPLTAPPSGYVIWLAGLNTGIQNAQQRAALAVNLRELPWHHQLALLDKLSTEWKRMGLESGSSLAAS